MTHLNSIDLVIARAQRLEAEHYARINARYMEYAMRIASGKVTGMSSTGVNDNWSLEGKYDNSDPTVPSPYELRYAPSYIARKDEYTTLLRRYRVVHGNKVIVQWECYISEDDIDMLPDGARAILFHTIDQLQDWGLPLVDKS